LWAETRRQYEQRSVIVAKIRGNERIKLCVRQATEYRECDKVGFSMPERIMQRRPGSMCFVFDGKVDHSMGNQLLPRARPHGQEGMHNDRPSLSIEAVQHLSRATSHLLRQQRKQLGPDPRRIRVRLHKG
jgi:hypothetical protein